MIKTRLKKWLGLESLEQSINILEDLLLHEQSKRNGFAVLKRHLQDPTKPPPRLMGEDIE